MRTLTVEVPIRPYSLNAERSSNRFARMKRNKETREAACLAATLPEFSRVPLFDLVAIEVYPWFKIRRDQDPANCMPSAKACIDGLVDAGVVDDDDGDHVAFVRFWPVQFGRDALVLVVNGNSKGGDT